MPISLSPEDLRQLQSRDLTREAVEEQLERTNNPSRLRLLKPCRTGDGIRVLSEADIKRLAAHYEAEPGTPGKFVPASGAAARMFAAILSCHHEQVFDHDKLADEHPAVLQVLTNLSRFPFFEDLRRALGSDNCDPERLLKEKNYGPILSAMVDEAKLGLPLFPKALLKFHRYPDHTRTALEEHLFEAADYAVNTKREAHIHFTMSPTHHEPAKNLLNAVLPRYRDVKFSAGFSAQDPALDTLAVGLDNLPFRDRTGTLVFRPSGHGALLKNLQDIPFDPVFVKNVDNVCVDRLKPLNTLYKRALAGLLIELRDRSFEYLGRIQKGAAGHETFGQIVEFLRTEFDVTPPASANETDLAEYCTTHLDRPIRVCGMVANQGEPGGGPFWVRGRNGIPSKQIVEKAQVDLNDPGQASVLKSATHFNPVDLVCSIRDYKGNRFDLSKFVDPEAVIVSEKPYQGKTLKALELPGLWNGSMACWNTVFVEVPVETFNPVKTVNDFLRPAHQPEAQPATG